MTYDHFVAIFDWHCKGLKLGLLTKPEFCANIHALVDAYDKGGRS